MTVRDPTFLFADLAGFTALTEAHGDTEAADLAERFCAAVADVLPEHGAQTVKTIGDAVMVRVEDPARAVEVAVRIVDDVGRQPGVPSVRVGMHCGPAVERDGDWFGATVNTAARISALARGGEILVSEASRRAAGAIDGVEFAPHGRHELKNVAEPVAVFRVRPVGLAHEELPLDPVCRMAVDPSGSAGSLSHHGRTYHFCSLDCVSAFSAAPERYTAAVEPAPAEPARSASLGRVVALVQGSSYFAFGMWSLLGRKHYRDTHAITSDDWVLNAHGGWLSVVGATLAASALRAPPTPAVRGLGFASAVALAVNDAALRRRLPSIYRVDLVYEAVLAALWPAAARARHR